MGRYIYLPKLKEGVVLAEAMRLEIAYAEGYDLILTVAVSSMRVAGRAGVVLTNGNSRCHSRGRFERSCQKGLDYTSRSNAF